MHGPWPGVAYLKDALEIKVISKLDSTNVLSVMQVKTHSAKYRMLVLPRCSS